jgi:hypothetical protein
MLYVSSRDTDIEHGRVATLPDLDKHITTRLQDTREHFIEQLSCCRRVCREYRSFTRLHALDRNVTIPPSVPHVLIDAP